MISSLASSGQRPLDRALNQVERRPDPKAVAAGRGLPHIYPYEGAGIKLYLWLPKAHAWSVQMLFDETYLPWSTEWLDYFEEWLVTNEWSGGGEHPGPRPKRWARTSVIG